MERRIAHPLLAIGLLRRRPVAAGGFLMLIATGLLVGVAFIPVAVVFLVPSVLHGADDERPAH